MYEHHTNNYELLDINEWFDDTRRSFGDLIDLGGSLLNLVNHMLSVYKKEMMGEARNKRTKRNNNANKKLPAAQTNGNKKPKAAVNHNT